MLNFFEDFECGVFESFGTNMTNVNKTCFVRNISSHNTMNKVFQNVSNDNFEYFSGNNYWCSDSERKTFNRCQKMRNKFIIYEALIFEDSNFEKFALEEIKGLENVKNLTAWNVGLTELTRNDLKPFKSLEMLDLSLNSLKYLESLLLLNLPSLKYLALHSNFIEKVDALAFDESSKKLTFVDLSWNKLKEIDENILNIIGKNNESELLLNVNQIERITRNSLSKSQKIFKKLDLSHNRLKEFSYKCSSINTLNLFQNKLEKFEINNCKVQSIDLGYSNLKSLSVNDVTSLNIYNNLNLTDLYLDVDDLKTLNISNTPNLKTITSHGNLKHERKLFFIKNHKINFGQPEIGTFSEMTLLQKLGLSNIGLTHIEYGMFSYQKDLEILDISRNKLASLNFNVLSSMKKLKMIDVSFNNLTKLDNVENIKKSFPDFQKIILNGNNWNCSYLSKLIQFFDKKGINVEPHFYKLTKNSPNIMGIACIPENKIEIIQPVSINEINATLSKKLNETIAQINELEISKQSFEFDFAVLKNETFNMQKSFFEMKSLFNNSLLLQEEKIDELQHNLDKIEKGAPKNSKVIETVLIIFLTASFVISAFYGYSKIKNNIYNKDNLVSIRARSTNTLDTTVEINEFQNHFSTNVLIN